MSLVLFWECNQKSFEYLKSQVSHGKSPLSSFGDIEIRVRERVA